MNNIHILCYPSHATHVFQGLDVVCFAILKRYYSEERAKFEQEGNSAVKKEHFLTVYAAAHKRAFAEDTVKAAFAKTGVYPYNPDAISQPMFKPSIESSNVGSGLPLPNIQEPATPFRIVRRMLRDVSQATSRDSSLASTRCPSPNRSGVQTPASDTDAHVAAVAESLQALQASSAGFLVSDQPIASSSQIPEIIPVQALPPLEAKIQELVSAVPDTDRERMLQEALQESLRREAHREGVLAGFQAALILQNLYCERVRAQLNTKEKGKAKNDRLLGSGMPVALSGDEFYERVAQKKKAQEAEATRKELVQKADQEFKDAMAA